MRYFIALRSLVVCDGVGKATGRDSALVDDCQLHLRDLLVNALDEFQDEVNQVFLFVLLEVVFRDQEAEIILVRIGRYTSHNLELVRSEREETLDHVG